MQYLKSDYNRKRKELIEQFQEEFKPESENLNNDKMDDLKRINIYQSGYSLEDKKIVQLDNGYDITTHSQDKNRVIVNGCTANITPINYSDIYPDTGVSNKKTVLKILGVVLAILGILLIILSLTIASYVLLGLLIPGCVLSVAGIIFVLVGLFLNNKYDKFKIHPSLSEIISPYSPSDNNKEADHQFAPEYEVSEGLEKLIRD